MKTTPRSRASNANRPKSRLATSLLVILLAVFLPLTGYSSAQAGLTSSQVVVVVNAESLRSRTLANYYIAFRSIPASNLIILDDIPDQESISVEVFRERILRPIFQQIAARGLSQQVQCITYSADFPTAIDIRADLKKVGKLPRYITPKASINGLTSLYAYSLTGNPNCVGFNANFYARQPIERYFVNPGGNITADRWTEANELTVAEKYIEAAEIFANWFEERPEQFPLAYLAAANYSQAGETSKGLSWLEKAIGAGWSFKDYLEADARFEPLHSEEDYEFLLLLLDEQFSSFQPPIGFDARTTLAPNGIPTKDPKLGLRYMLSTVLGVTRGAGTKVSEAIDILRRATLADGSHPSGKFFFCVTNDVRTKTRMPGFAQTVKELEGLGFDAEIIDQKLPSNEPAVLGAQIGTPVFDWPASKSKIVPGAIVENLTSHGGIMSAKGGQTKLTELLRSGAAGSSGTVTEPYSLQPKFPHPQLYSYYAQGASLSEAFLLSVTGPYQLLIVGDPLCRPFANLPSLPIDTNLRQLSPGEKLNLQLAANGIPASDLYDSRSKRATLTAPLLPTQLEVSLDNKQARRSKALGNLSINLDKRLRGYHEVTLRFIANDPLRQASETVVPFWVGDLETAKLSVAESKSATLDKATEDAALQHLSFARGFRFRKESCSLSLEVASGLEIKKWEVHIGNEVLASGKDADSAKAIELDYDKIGIGPVRIQARVETEGEPLIQCEPVWIFVGP